MFIKNWKNEILTVPNLLSLFRLSLIPVYVRIYVNAATDSSYLQAGVLMAISCLTDIVDGRIARQFNMISKVGKVLDPLADKLTQLALILCLTAKYSVLYPVLAFFLVKELFQLFLFLFHIRRGKTLSGALPAGKVCTTILFISLIALVLFPRIDPRVVNGIVLTDLAFLLNAFICYCFAYFGKNRKIQDLM